MLKSLLMPIPMLTLFLSGFQDRPDHPPSVAIEYCQAMLARIKWSPGANNNAPLTGYVIQYQTAMDKSMWYTAVDSVPDGTTQYDVRSVVAGSCAAIYWLIRVGLMFGVLQQVEAEQPVLVQSSLSEQDRNQRAEQPDFRLL